MSTKAAIEQAFAGGKQAQKLIRRQARRQQRIALEALMQQLLGDIRPLFDRVPRDSEGEHRWDVASAKATGILHDLNPKLNRLSEAIGQAVAQNAIAMRRKAYLAAINAGAVTLTHAGQIPRTADDPVSVVTGQPKQQPFQIGGYQIQVEQESGAPPPGRFIEGESYFARCARSDQGWCLPEGAQGADPLKYASADAFADKVAPPAPKGDVPQRGDPELDRWSAIFDQRRAARLEWERTVDAAVSEGRRPPNKDNAPEEERTSGRKWESLPPDLYHATTALSSVMEQGLQSREELDQWMGKGLGGGSARTISFTADRATATVIANAIREARAVASGERPVQSLLNELKELYPEAYAAVLKKYKGESAWVEGQPYPRGLMDVIAGVRTERDPRGDWEAKEGWIPLDKGWKAGGEKAGHMVHALWQRPATAEESLHDRAEVYRTFSFYRGIHGGPEDPLFFTTDWEALAKVPESEIGVVHVQPIKGALGIQMGSLGEWRTYSGKAVKIVHHAQEAFNPDEPRDEAGKWTSGGAAPARGPGPKAEERHVADAAAILHKDLGVPQEQAARIADQLTSTAEYLDPVEGARHRILAYERNNMLVVESEYIDRTPTGPAMLARARWIVERDADGSLAIEPVVVYLHPKLQGQGIGKRMMDDGERVARANGIDKLRFLARSDEGHGFIGAFVWQKLGYHPTETSRRAVLVQYRNRVPGAAALNVETTSLQDLAKAPHGRDFLLGKYGPVEYDVERDLRKHARMQEAWQADDRAPIDGEPAEPIAKRVAARVVLLDDEGMVWVIRGEAGDLPIAVDPRPWSRAAPIGRRRRWPLREAFNPDEARDEQGKWTSGGGGFMASPNVADAGNTPEKAGRQFGTDHHQAFVALHREVFKELGITDPTETPAIGDWTDGAEVSVLTDLPYAVDRDTMRYAAAVMGLAGDQKVVAAFTPDLDGPHVRADFRLPMGWQEARDVLTVAGIANRTLVPDGDGVKVTILDDTDDHRVTAAAYRLGETYGAEVTAHPGHADFVGDWNDREVARGNYRREIEAYVSQYPDRPHARVRTPDRRWLLEAQGLREADNCGTGAGGFQAGNTCAKSGGASLTERAQAVARPTTDEAIAENAAVRAEAKAALLARLPAQMTPEDRASFAGVVGQLSAVGAAHLADNATAIVVHPSIEAMADSLLRKPGNVVGAWAYTPGEDPGETGTLHLVASAALPPGIFEGVVQHETGHAIDGHHRYSGTSQWKKAWESEIVGKLSKQADHHPKEGFAEFSRLLASGQHRLAREEYPQTFALMRGWGFA